MRILKAKFYIEPFNAQSIMRKIERKARTCHKSEGNICRGSAEKMVAFLREREHYPMFDHAHISVLFTTDRGVTHEIVRHRIGAYAQESTRYCNYSKDKFGKQIAVIDIRKHCKTAAGFDEWFRAMQDAERHYFRMLELGESPQIARSVLPNSLKTEIWCTYDLTEWRHFFKMRTSKAAHPQMREVVQPLLKEFRRRLPLIFNDVGVVED